MSGLARRGAVLGLAVFAASLGFERPAPPIPGHAQWSDVAMLASCLAAFVAWARGTMPRPRASMALAAIGAYVGWGVVSAVVNGASPYRVLGLAELAAVFVVAESVGGTERDRDLVLRASIVGAVALAALALVGAGLSALGVASPLGDPTGGNLGVPFRATGPCASSNLLASVLAGPCLLLVLDGARLVGPRARVAGLSVVGVALALSMSRSLVGLAAGAIVIGVSIDRLSRRRAALALAGLVGLVLASLRLHVRHDAGGWVVSTAPGIRWRVMGSALEAACAHPWFGLGPGALPALAAWDEGGPPRRWGSHSTPIELVATMGWPSLLAVAVLVVALACAARRGARGAADLALVGALAGALLDALAMDVQDFRHVWLAMGLVAAAGAREADPTRDSVGP